MSVKQRIESYPKHFDGTVDISKIPYTHKCNACSSDSCEKCGHSSRCDCARVNHGIPLPLATECNR